MILDVWPAPLWTYLWQVALHASVLGLIFYVWVHRVGLPSGTTRRRLLELLLVLPMITAAVPGRSGIEFAERLAWLNSARLLAVPIGSELRVHHLVLLGAVLMIALTCWQEVLAFVRRPRATGEEAPEALVGLVRATPGWDRSGAVVSPLDSIMVATTGVPWRRRIVVSRGALAGLSETELELVIAHEQAHWHDGRWLRTHALFAIRMLQCYHPVALWAFREYCIELEIECDHAAAAGRDRRALARVLLRMYHATDRRDVAARAALRKRVDVLLGDGLAHTSLPPATVAVASIVMLLVLPWIV